MENPNDLYAYRVWDIIGKRMLRWKDVCHLPAWEIFPGTPEQRPYIPLRCTGKKDTKDTMVFEGDIIENPDGLRMKICYGTYQGYCPADEAWMDSVGFYARCPGMPDMPIGPLEEYAVVVGNVYENPDLFAEREGECKDGKSFSGD